MEKQKAKDMWNSPEEQVGRTCLNSLRIAINVILGSFTAIPNTV